MSLLFLSTRMCTNMRPGTILLAKSSPKPNYKQLATFASNTTSSSFPTRYCPLSLLILHLYQSTTLKLTPTPGLRPSPIHPLHPHRNPLPRHRRPNPHRRFRRQELLLHRLARRLAHRPGKPDPLRGRRPHAHLLLQRLPAARGRGGGIRESGVPGLLGAESKGNEGQGRAVLRRV